jgi:hypothetical protein
MVMTTIKKFGIGFLIVSTTIVFTSIGIGNAGGGKAKFCEARYSDDADTVGLPFPKGTTDYDGKTGKWVTLPDGREMGWSKFEDGIIYISEAQMNHCPVYNK